MHLDVHDLREFYYRSRLGRAAQKVIRGHLQQIWPEAKGQTIAGYGFAVPLLRPYLAAARRVIGLMPGPQGVMSWPPAMANVSVLVEETQWPIQTGSIDKLVVMHGLETSENQSAVLEECWRVLGPGGRAVFIVPNRAGLWSRSDRTPFGFGRPYSMAQLETQLRKNHFSVERAFSTLYQPPIKKPRSQNFADMAEKLGRHLPFFAAGGVLVVEVSKQVILPKRPGLAQKVRAPIEALEAGVKPAGQLNRSRTER